ENFDGYGRWREKNYIYRLTPNKKSARPIALAKSDATSTIRGDQVSGIFEFKTLLKRKYRDEIIGAFTEFLYSYAIGRAVRIEEQGLLGKMHEKIKVSGYQPRVLLSTILDSEAFSNPRSRQ
ncbi:MAG: DUF1585 domain-containing protein, partial [Planctomycetaceae bacterium]